MNSRHNMFGRLQWQVPSIVFKLIVKHGTSSLVGLVY